MPNISKGAATRSEVLNVRATRSERALLERHYGTAGRALRAFINQEVRKSTGATSTTITEAGTAGE